MPYYTKEQIAKAREMDLLTYLQNFEPAELVHLTGNTWTTVTHDSLKISNGKWMWWSRGFGGVSALDYLTKVRGDPFIKAVEKILGQAAGEPSFLMAKTKTVVAPEPAPKKLLLPEHAGRFTGDTEDRHASGQRLRRKGSIGASERDAGLAVSHPR